MSDKAGDIQPTDHQPEPEAAAPEAVVEDSPLTGLTLVRSEFNGEHGAEHHWFEVQKGEKPEKYQAEVDAFIASRYGLTSDDITITVAS